MSVLERRLQVLLDQERYNRLAREAEVSGRSVAAVVREAIDARYPSGSERRTEAMRRFLEWPPDEGPAESWEEIKQALDDDLARDDLA